MSQLYYFLGLSVIFKKFNARATGSDSVEPESWQHMQHLWYLCLVSFSHLNSLESIPHTKLSHVADRVLVLQPGVRPEPLRWESRVQDIIRVETSGPHVVSIGESSPRDLLLNAKTKLSSRTSKLQWWRPHDKQLARQENNPTH